jgi:hypothetical protein
MLKDDTQPKEGTQSQDDNLAKSTEDTTAPNIVALNKSTASKSATKLLQPGNIANPQHPQAKTAKSVPVIKPLESQL